MLKDCISKASAWGKAEMRKCNQCDFKTGEGSVQEQQAEMQDHLITHNPTPAQWTEAYRLMEEARNAKKKANKAEE